MKTSIENKTALITGAGQGVGRCLAIHLASLHVHLILVGRTESKLLETKKLCEPYNVHVDIYTVDLTDENEILAMYQSIQKLDYVINNAAYLTTNAFELTSTDDMDLIYKTNVRAPFIVSKQALPLLRQSDVPTIINMGSVVSNKGYENQVAYVMSKHALMGMTKVMAKELSKEDIRVHILCPGGIRTDMVAKASPELVNQPCILPEDIADIIEFILTHRTNAIIDQVNIHRYGKEPFL